jgi:hypothetical protein
MDLATIYRMFYPRATEYTFFQQPTVLQSILGHKASLNIYKHIEIISYILPHYNGIKL